MVNLPTIKNKNPHKKSLQSQKILLILPTQVQPNANKRRTNPPLLQQVHNKQQKANPPLFNIAMGIKVDHIVLESF